MTRCGIVLAAGDGTRLQPFIQRWRGDALPKQYVNFLGPYSMLEHTFRRAELLIPPERLFTVVGRAHLSFRDAARQLARRPPGTVIVQPQNKETGPGLLLPLAHIAARHPESVAVVLPSDHFIAEERLFMGYVDLACRAVERDPRRLVLLGVEPHAPEPDYGYIIPGRRATDGACIKRVARFVEKPPPAQAQELIRQGALWNTFVMVVQPQSLMELVRWTAPALFAAFHRIRGAIGAPHEQALVEEAYQTLPPVNFSEEVLGRTASNDPLQISVIPARAVSWNDWGSEQRLRADLHRHGHSAWVNQFPAYPVPAAGATAAAV
ncbi:MAG: sugar phosphate nucleotidyltransferase [Nitrospirota bacterium]